jgi:hypothetical protein
MLNPYPSNVGQVDDLKTAVEVYVHGKLPKIAIFRMCYGENGTVKFFKTLADNVFRHNYSMMQI